MLVRDDAIATIPVLDSPRAVAASRRLAQALRAHYPEYLMEAAGLALFMVSACMFGILLFAAHSPIVAWLPSELPRRALMGVAMGLTLIAIVYNPWGRQSGAHLNPSVTLTFWTLGKVNGADAVWYGLSHFIGGLVGVACVAALLPQWLAAPGVNYVVTTPGAGGVLAAWVVEFAISAAQVSVILVLSNHARWARFTGLVAGGLLASYIVWATPFSGMSMNPARTLSSAVPAGVWSGWWVYFTAPPLGMLTAAAMYVAFAGRRHVHCAKLQHDPSRRCIFCGYRRAAAHGR